MKRWLALICVVAVAQGSDAAEQDGGRDGVQLFYRMIAAQTNAPILPKTRTVYGPRGSAVTGTTGMADSGFTEYPFCKGIVDYSFAERGAFYPRIASGLPIDPAGINYGDILIDHVYEPDGCVWGPAGREFHQTFTATRKALVSVSLLVASDPGTFRGALVEGGPGGRQIGPAQTLYSGHSMEWGLMRWKAGTAPLVPGRTYAIRMWREDGKPWTPYLHATGNAYDGGLMYVDGKPWPESDIAAWIVEEPPDLQRAIIEGTDEEGWVYNVTETWFRSPVPYVRMISLAIGPVAERASDMVIRVWEEGPEPRLVAGPEQCLAAGPANGVHESFFMFGPTELTVDPKKRYKIDAFTIPHRSKVPEVDEIALTPKDMRARVYVQADANALPAIGNLKAQFNEENSLHLTWAASGAFPVRIEAWRVGSSDIGRFEAKPGAEGSVLPKLWPGHDYDFWLEAVGSEGFTWKTPLYRLRVPGGPFPPPPPYVYPEHPAGMIHLAPPTLSKAPEYGPIRCRSRVELANTGFEDGLEGWVASEVVKAVGREHEISPPVGKMMAGWSHIAGERREQVFEKSHVYQVIHTTPGHVYLLSVRAYTSAEDRGKSGPRGDTRVRLFADPEGGTDFEGANASQWYWTDGRWMRFQHQWIARGDESSVGAGFFRWRDLDRASVYVDHMQVFDLGSVPLQTEDPAASPRDLPKLALNDVKVEKDERAEAELAAPPGYVITGLGARAAADNITTLRIRVQPLLADGTLGEAELIFGGWEADAGLEAAIDLPGGYVATGFGARIAPEWDVKTFAVWGRPLLPDGSLGEEKEFRAGVEPNGGLEKTIRLEPGRVLISAGLRCSFNDVGGIRGKSAVVSRTAMGSAGGQ